MNLLLAGTTGKMGLAIMDQAPRDARVARVTAVSRQDDALPPGDALIDFTRPLRTIELAEMAAAQGIAFVSGTTGLNEEQMDRLRECVDSIPVLWAANMSIGVNVLMSLVEQAAAKLNDQYDIEIFEMHHRHKVDAPSGTALALGRAAAAGRGIGFDTHSTLSREGHTGEREPGTIGFSTARGGGVIGDHRVIFAGDYERIELAHLSQDRRIYASGAIEAAWWLRTQRPGFYSMRDMIGN